MMRPRDEVISPMEDLYRGLMIGYTEGQVVNEKAIDLEGTSVQRSAYAGVESVLSERRPGAAAIRMHDVPPAKMLPNGVEWEWFVVDDPSEEQGVGHAELRARRTQDRPSLVADKPGGKIAKMELRSMLAGAMRVLIEPT